MHNNNSSIESKLFFSKYKPDHKIGEGSFGKIYQAEIDKKHIFAYIDQRGESELIIDPKYLENVEMVEDLSMDMTMRL